MNEKTKLTRRRFLTAAGGSALVAGCTPIPLPMERHPPVVPSGGDVLGGFNANLQGRFGRQGRGDLFEGVDNGDRNIIDRPINSNLASVNPRQIEVRTIPYTGYEATGTIIVHEGYKKLYLTNGDGTATEYPIATQRPGVNENYNGLYVGLKRENPSWTPTDTMVGAKPTSADDPNNPLGEYAINLNRNGQDTLIRIHGTDFQSRSSIGTAASAGCIRMLNEHVANLFYRVKPGAKVRYQYTGPINGLQYGRPQYNPPSNVMLR